MPRHILRQSAPRVFSLLVMASALPWVCCEYVPGKAAIQQLENSNTEYHADAGQEPADGGVSSPFGDNYILEHDGSTYVLELDVHSRLTGRIAKLDGTGLTEGAYPEVEQVAVQRGRVRGTTRDLAKDAAPDEAPSHNNSLTDTSGTDMGPHSKGDARLREIIVPYGDFYVTPMSETGDVYVIELVDNTATGNVTKVGRDTVTEVEIEDIISEIPPAYLSEVPGDRTRTLAADDGICDCDVVCTCYSRYLGSKWDVRAARQVGGTWIYGSWGKVTRTMNFGLREGTSGRGLCQCAFEVTPTHRELYGTARIEAGDTLSLYAESYRSARFDVGATFTCNNG